MKITYIKLKKYNCIEIKKEINIEREIDNLEKKLKR